MSRNKKAEEGKKTKSERIHQKSKEDDVMRGTNFKKTRNRYLNA